MSHRTLIGGTAYEITRGRTLVGGTGYDIVQGRTHVGGTGYDINLGIPLRKRAVGESVYTYVNGKLTEFIVVHQGNPDGNLYDASCDGTWLMMKDLISNQQWSEDGTNRYNTSYIHSYLNGTFFYSLTPKVQKAVKDVKIPYAIEGDFERDGVAAGANGLPAKVFLLAYAEVGWNATSSSRTPVDGSCLSYFLGAGESKRRAIYNGGYEPWWLRTPDGQSETAVWFVNMSGGHETSTSISGTDQAPYTRPAMIMYGKTLTNKEGIILG